MTPPPAPRAGREIKPDTTTAHIAKIISGEVGWFNGWHATEEAEAGSCLKAAKKIMRYLVRP